MGFTAGGAAGTAGAGLAIGAGVWVAICGAAGGAGFTAGDGAGAAAAFGIVVLTPAERGCCGSVTASCCGGGAWGGCGSGKNADFAPSACALAIILPPSNLASFISFSQAVTTGSVALRQCATASGNSVTITSPLSATFSATA